VHFPLSLSPFEPADHFVKFGDHPYLICFCNKIVMDAQTVFISNMCNVDIICSLVVCSSQNENNNTIICNIFSYKQ
jgi:hypothetical protein